MIRNKMLIEHKTARLTLTCALLVEYQFVQKATALKHCETTDLHRVTRDRIDLSGRRSKQAWL